MDSISITKSPSKITKHIVKEITKQIDKQIRGQDFSPLPPSLLLILTVPKFV